MIQHSFAHHPSPSALLDDTNQPALLKKVREALETAQGELELRPPEQIDAVTVRVVQELVRRTIDIPRIIIVPGGKPWTYVLIPHDEVTAAATLPGLAVKWRVAAE